MQTILVLKQFDGTGTAYPAIFDANQEDLINTVSKQLTEQYPGSKVARVDVDLTQPTPSTFQ